MNSALSSPFQQAEVLELFYSYVPEDEQWQKRLEVHLSNLQRQGFIRGWHKRDINAGTEWKREIDVHLNAAHIILLLVSPDFIASEYCYSFEMKRAIERHELGEAHIIPVLLRPTDWKGTLFEHIQVLPSNAIPLSKWQDHDEALLDVVNGVRKVVEDVKLSYASVAPFHRVQQINFKGRSPAPTTSNVPYRRNRFFTNREALLEQLHQRFFASPSLQIQAVNGLGGIGKTQIAIEYAYRYAREYSSVFWVRADAYDTLISDFVLLANQLGIAEEKVHDQSIVLDFVKRWLAASDNRWLLILDNACNMDMVYDFLPIHGKGHILFTTQAQATGGVARQMHVEKMQVEDGALFVLRRANIVEPDALLEQVSALDRARAEAISLAMDGLPLALDQAAAYIEETSCGLSDYLNLYYMERAKLLSLRGGLAFEHPESVVATWSLSFEKLSQINPASAELLRLCAFLHPDAIPEEIITEGSSELGPILQTVSSAPVALNDAIKELLRYSLIRRNPDTKTLTIHRLVQAVLKDSMDVQNQQQWTERAINAVNQTFPNVEFDTWQRCQRCLAHAQICAELIKQAEVKSIQSTSLLLKAGRYLLERAQYSQAESLYRQALAMRERVLGQEHPDVAESLNDLGELYDHQGKYSEAESLYQRALAIREQALGPQDPKVAESLNNLGELYSHRGKYNEAESLYQRALAIREQVLGSQHPKVAESLNDLGLLYYHQSKYAQAEPLYQRALAIREQTLGPQHPDVARSLNNLGGLYYRRGKYAQAEPLYQRALAIREQTLGPLHPDVATSLNNLALLYYHQAKYTQAEPLNQRALAIREQVLGPFHPTLAITLNHLARLYAKQGRFLEAEALYQRDLAITEQALGSHHSDVAITLNDLGQLYADQERYAEAETIYQRALSMQQQALGTQHPRAATTLYNLGLLYTSQGRYAEAEPAYQNALAIQEQTLGPDHPYTLMTLEHYAQLLLKTEREQDAQELLSRIHAARANNANGLP